MAKKKTSAASLVVVLLSPPTGVEPRNFVLRFRSFCCRLHVFYSDLEGMPVVVAILETYPAAA